MNLSRQWQKHANWLVRYCLAVVTAVLSLLIRLALTPVLGLAGPFLLFAPAVMLSAWHGGLGPGLVATGVSSFLAAFFLLEPTNSVAIDDPSGTVRLLLFVAVGVQISILSGKLLSAKRQAERNLHQVKAAAASLEQSEERYRLLVEGVRDYAIFALDAAGHVLSWNAGAQRLKGYNSDEILGQPVAALFTATDRHQGKPQRALEQAVIADKFEETGWQVRQDGSQFWAESVIATLRDETGNLRGFSVIIRDISDRKQAEEQFQATLKALSDMRFALDQAAIVAIADSNGKITYVNDKFCDISRYQREELLGQDHRILNSGYHPKHFFQNLWSEIKQGRIWAGEIRNRAKDGTLYWVHTTIVPFLNERGEPIQYLAIRFDITQRKQAETALQKLNNTLEQQISERTAQLQQALSLEATLKRITDKVRDSLDETQILQTAVQELGTGLGVNSCNAALYDLEQGTSTICYEYNPAILPMKDQVIVMATAPEIYRTLLHGDYLQFCNLIADPMRGRIAMLACPLVDDQDVLGDLWLIADRDYSFQDVELRLVQQVANQCAIAIRQARLYQATQSQVKALEQLNWLKDDFLSTVSHELRTPVSNMKMSIRMLELILNRDNNLHTANQKAFQYLQILDYECGREISLINDLLDLQRLEAGKVTTELATVQISSWLHQMVKPFQERAVARQQELTIELTQPEMPAVIVDIFALERVLNELLNNACKYTPPEGSITVCASMSPGNLHLCVSNTGSEIPEGELHRIFDKFYRVPKADPWKQGGTGLGLALVERLINYLGGTVQVASATNQTTFTIDVPVLVEKAPDSGITPEEAPDPG